MHIKLLSTAAFLSPKCTKYQILIDHNLVSFCPSPFKQVAMASNDGNYMQNYSKTTASISKFQTGTSSLQ